LVNDDVPVEPDLALSSKLDEVPAAPAVPVADSPSFALCDRDNDDSVVPAVGALTLVVGLAAAVGAVGFATGVLVVGFGTVPDGMVGTDGLLAIKPCLSLNIYQSWG
jgi:hypothetical protein